MGIRSVRSSPRFRPHASNEADDLAHRVHHAALLALPPDAEITISLEALTLEVPGGGAAQPEARSTRATFPIDPFARQCLLRGVDQLGYLLSFDEAIRAYEEARGHVSTS